MAGEGRGEPVLSVVLPTYDSAHTLGAAARSVLTGNTVALELIVIDDGSTDDTAAVLAELTTDPRVRVISRPNRGLAASLNEGIAAARAPFIARMDADDVSAPGRFDAQVEFMAAHPDVVLAGGQIRRVINGVAESSSRFPLDHDTIVAALLRGQHAVCHPAVVMRRSALDRVGGYWDEGVAEDWDLFLRLSEVGDLANLDRHVLDYSFHGGGINASSMVAVRTNIGLAVRNHYRRTCGLDTLNVRRYREDLTVPKRMKIRAESLSLGLYRRSMQAGTSSKTAKTVLLAGAALSWPPFAVRRIRETAHAS